MYKVLLAAALTAAVAGVALVKVGGGKATSPPAAAAANMTPLSEFAAVSSDPPKTPLSLLFIHHSVGGMILADPGPKLELAQSIWKSHPDGGGARRLLEAAGYRVHEASYDSVVGAHTDRGDWLPKFRHQLDRMLTTALDDQPLPAGEKNRIVLWKSCFPNNLLDEAAVEKTRAEMRALLPLFAQHPDILFVHLTTPPLTPNVAAEPVWKWLARALLGKPQPKPRLEKSGPLARQLDQWVATEWLKDYPQKNVAVFDLYDVLTDHGTSNYLAFVSDAEPYDSHPSRAGTAKAAAELVPFLNRAVRRAGLSP